MTQQSHSWAYIQTKLSLKNIHAPYVHCSTIHNSQDMETTSIPSTNEWIKKMWYIYTVEYYSPIKKNKIMPFTATCMELETLTLNEVNQKEKDKYHMISLISGT